jgi:hypothetical protein
MSSLSASRVVCVKYLLPLILLHCIYGLSVSLEPGADLTSADISFSKVLLPVFIHQKASENGLILRIKWV